MGPRSWALALHQIVLAAVVAHAPAERRALAGDYGTRPSQTLPLRLTRKVLRHRITDLLETRHAHEPQLAVPPGLVRVAEDQGHTPPPHPRSPAPLLKLLKELHSTDVQIAHRFTQTTHTTRKYAEHAGYLVTHSEARYFLAEHYGIYLELHDPQEILDTSANIRAIGPGTTFDGLVTALDGINGMLDGNETPPRLGLTHKAVGREALFWAMQVCRSMARQHVKETQRRTAVAEEKAKGGAQTLKRLWVHMVGSGRGTPDVTELRQLRDSLQKETLQLKRLGIEEFDGMYERSSGDL